MARVVRKHLRKGGKLEVEFVEDERGEVALGTLLLDRAGTND